MSFHTRFVWHPVAAQDQGAFAVDVEVLIEIIRDGSDFPQSRMPAFGDRLTDTDIEAILEFIKTSWGPQEKAYQDQVTDQDQAGP